ncbi:uncharacterized protein LOC109838778 [Asparagus officinalis]|uniref:uncharacterized protein LOC109838778 n=1 Tax=Asparagus officinalis TaxID=4686 RepID=UPI00098E1FD5|nr:uncharacterized protein LOC109838778 [Asparagus officinalis]
MWVGESNAGRNRCGWENGKTVARLLQKGEERGFPGMLGSLDCMHWEWKNCPTAWAGQYSGRHGGPTIILEAVASYDLWIWHAFFGLPGSNNDINVLQASNLFDNLTQGITPPAHYTIQGKNYDVGYYLADGIYPKWPTLVQTISKSEDKKKQYFAMMQEACRKDVERAFGVLQSRFAIIKGPARFWDKRTLHDIMTTCIIMHNMIIEDERDEQEDIIVSTPPSISNVEDIGMNDAERFRQFLTRHKKFKDKEAHFALRNALIEHLWERHGNEVILSSNVLSFLITCLAILYKFGEKSPNLQPQDPKMQLTAKNAVPLDLDAASKWRIGGRLEKL